MDSDGLDAPLPTDYDTTGSVQTCVGTVRPGYPLSRFVACPGATLVMLSVPAQKSSMSYPDRKFCWRGKRRVDTLPPQIRPDVGDRVECDVPS